jgi:hypothetical protein
MLLASRVAAQERVLVLGVGSEPMRSGFSDALRIQLRDRAAVEVGPALERGSLDAMVSQASDELRDGHATLAVWVEESTNPDGTSIVLYMVGRRAGRVLVEVARFRAADEPGIDRALALKVSEVLAAVEKAGVQAMAERLAAPAEVPEPPPHREATTHLGGLVALGIWGGLSTSPQLGAQIHAGGRLEHGAFSLELVGGARFVTPLSVSDPRGEVEVTEIVPGGALHGHAKFGLIALGLEVGAGARLLSVTGTSPLGRTGEAELALPYITVAPEVRLLIVPWFEIAGAFGVEILPLRKRYAVNDIPLLDLGQARGVGHISAIFSMPRAE